MDMLEFINTSDDESKRLITEGFMAMLACAIRDGNIRIVKYLMSLPKEYGIDPSMRDNCAIRLASFEGKLEIVKYLMSLPKEYGIDPKVGMNHAYLGGRWDILKYFSDIGIVICSDREASSIIVVHIIAVIGIVTLICRAIFSPEYINNGI